jgi:tetratricopeptide (TPR) repeat protein
MNKDILHKPVFHILLILIIGIISYSNAFDVPFDFDDEHNIMNNRSIRNFSFSPTGNRYIGNLTFAMNYKVHGLDVAGYHIVNTGIHIINALLFYWLVLLTFKTPYFSTENKNGNFTTKPGALWTALCAALFFVAHPIQTQAVTYIVQRFASLVAMFGLFSMIMYIKARLSMTGAGTGSGPDRLSGDRFFSGRSLFFYSLSLLSVLCSMKTKEIAFTLPLIIVLYEFMFFRGRINRRILYVIPLVLTMLIIPMNIAGMNRPVGEVLGEITSKPVGEVVSDIGAKTKVQTEMSRLDYLYTESRVLVTYIRLIFLPINQNLDYDYPIYRSLFNTDVVLSFLFLFSIFGAGVYLLIRYRRTVSNAKLISFGIFWFFVTLSVESSIIPIEDVIFEHRMYLPSIGMFIAVSAFIMMAADTFRERWKLPGGTVAAAAAVIIVMLAGATYARNMVWKDAVTLWEDVVSKSPEKARPHSNLGRAYWKKGLSDKAFEQYSIALKINPIFPQALTNIANIYREKGQIYRALEYYQMAIILSPTYTNARFNLGLLYLQKGETSNAYNEFKKITQIDPGDMRARQFLNYITGKGRKHPQ